MKLSNLPRVDRNMRAKHVADIKKKVEDKKKKIESGICPKCNGVLIERRGPYGRFLGCGNYPKCKYVQKI